METQVVSPHTKGINIALSNLDKVRSEFTKIGKPGGHKQNELLSYLDGIEVVLRQLEPLGDMVKVIVQQSQTVLSTVRSMERASETRQIGAANGDDGSSETAGQ